MLTFSADDLSGTQVQARAAPRCTQANARVQHICIIFIFPVWRLSTFAVFMYLSVSVYDAQGHIGQSLGQLGQLGLRARAISDHAHDHTDLSVSGYDAQGPRA